MNKKQQNKLPPPLFRQNNPKQINEQNKNKNKASKKGQGKHQE